MRPPLRVTWLVRVALWLLAGLPGLATRAVPPAPVPVEREASWRIANFAADAGVQRRMVFDVAFEANRTAWFAVSDGLYRYDGYRWQRFTTAEGLPSSFVRTVYVDRDGAIWVGTDKGAGVFDPSKPRFDTRGTVTHLAGPNIRRITQTTDGALWFCCDRWPNMSVAGGLTRLSHGTFRTFMPADGLPSDHILSLFEQSTGRLIALTGEGPAVLTGERWSRLEDPGFPAGDHTWSIHETRDGELFAEAYDTTLRWNHTQWSPCVASGLSRFSPLCVTADGSVIRANHRAGDSASFARWDGSRFVKASADLPEPGLELLVLRQAPDGAIWAVGRGTILRWEYLAGAWTWRPDLGSPLLEDSRHRLWFDYPAGLTVLEGEITRRIPAMRPPLVEEPDGTIWSNGTTGVVRWTDGERESIPETTSGLGTVNQILADAKAGLWMAGSRRDGAPGLALVRNGRWTRFDDAIPRDHFVGGIAADPTSGIWGLLNRSGVIGYELIRVTPDGLRILPATTPWPPLNPPNIAVDRQHLYLFGYGGLWESPLANLREFQRPSPAANGVFAEARTRGDVAAFVIHESYEGSAGILLRRPDGWLQRAIRFGGPLVLDRRDWLLAADGSEFGLWHAHDWNSPNFIPLPADTLKILGLLRTETGEFWVGTSKGALHYAPQSLPPDTRFTGTGALRNGHLEGFEVAGIAPFSPTSRPSRFLFSWRVDSDSWSGYADWPKEGIPVGDRAPGNHRLEVRARDGLGLEDPTPAEFSFAVVPVPIQDRPWFRPVLAVVGGGFGVLCLALTSATRRLRRHADRLEEEVRARTAQLRSDLDRRERMALALQESESRVRANLENTPNVGIRWYDRSGRVVYWNRAAESIYGWRADEVIGQPFESFLLGPTEAAEFRGILEQIRQSGEPVGPYEVLARRRDGSPCWILATTFALPLGQGETGFACMDVDITERKRNERAQQAIARISEVALSARTLEELFPSIHAVIGELMPATNFYVALLDREGTQIDFPYYRDLVTAPPPPRKQGRYLTEYVLRTGRPLLASAEEILRLVEQGETILQSPNPASWLGVPLRTQEHTIGVVAVQSYSDAVRYRERDRDLLSLMSYHVASAIERKRAEQENDRLELQLVQAQKMESIGRLAGGVAHDFNNMLQTILGNVELALEQTPPRSALHEDLREIRGAAQRSADLTRQLLAFARKQTIRPQLLDLNATVGGMLKMLRRLIGENLHLVWQPARDLWLVRVDPSQVDQILANLCVNARDAIDGIGHVTIETANASVDTNTPSKPADAASGDYVRLAVGDNGRGMTPEVRSHLFEPFFTTKAVGEGTGLGLATVYGIVTQNGGFITVDSEPGHGAMFSIHLPRAEPAPPEAPSPARPVTVRGEETILFVEDEVQILTLGRRILEHLGYTVLTAANPLAALTLATGHPDRIDLLITDVVMPGLNGRELRDRLRTVRPEVKCLFISGYTADVIGEHGVLCEGVDFLAKPFDVQALGRKVRELLDRPEAPRS